MTRRALWKGKLNGPGVDCGVALYSALSSDEKVSFHIVNRKTGNRVERRFVDSETEQPVERDAQVRGFQLDDGNYVLIEPETLAALIPHSDKTIAIKHFLPCDAVDKLYFDKPYYLAPAAKADEEAFRAFSEALEKGATTAFAQAVLFRRNRGLILRVHEGIVIATTLNYDYEVRSARNAFRGLSEPHYDEELLDLAGHLIQTKLSRFDPAEFHDRYNAALLKLVRAKMEGRPLPKPDREPEQKVVDLREALRLSALQSERKSDTKPKSTRGKMRKAG
ncbi:non-homologous end joining protein Ku [Rhizobium sp. C1]|uniref:non-homologous end joining protein Ku n=1 Tax=Rhizobium sp. C1 TaxID=1349799 RepID=UPI001E38EC66|nr:Ku protein [Rhizobium sp. C1]MCD2178131.1 Ku protein [Rhizobium sp. C1]